MNKIKVFFYNKNNKYLNLVSSAKIKKIFLNKLQ